ncbi:hypothetical protein ABIF86_000057 [Bradyrhizobium japonicum]
MAAGREFSTEKASSHCGRAPGLPTSGNVNSIPAPANVVHRVCSRSSDVGGVSLYSSSRLMTAHDNPLRSANCFRPVQHPPCGSQLPPRELRCGSPLPCEYIVMRVDLHAEPLPYTAIAVAERYSVHRWQREGRCRRSDHRVRHLGCDDDGLGNKPAGPDELLLPAQHLLRGISTLRSPRATMMASDKWIISQYDQAPSGSRSWQRHRRPHRSKLVPRPGQMVSEQRTATQSTPSSRPNARSARSFLVRGEILSSAPGRLAPL